MSVIAYNDRDVGVCVKVDLAISMTSCIGYLSKS